MATKTGIKQVFEISSDVSKGCPHCDNMPRADNNDIDKRMNHLLQEHGYELLHVGQETTTDLDGHPWQRTVAIVGK